MAPSFRVSQIAYLESLSPMLVPSFVSILPQKRQVTGLVSMTAPTTIEIQASSCFLKKPYVIEGSKAAYKARAPERQERQN